MSDHLSSRTLREYRHGRLAPEQMLTASDHLAACANCRQALGETDDGPGYEEIAAAADGTLDPAAREALAARLTEAPAAAAELADLEQFRREMAAEAGRLYGPETPLPSTETIDPPKILTFPASRWLGRRARWSAAAAALLLAASWWGLETRQTVPDSVLLLTDRHGHHPEGAALPAALQAAVTSALRQGHLDAPSPSPGLHPRPGRLAGSATSSLDGFHPLAPLGAVVREAQPTLHWTPCPGATAYVVTATSLDGADTRTSPVLPATQTAWTPAEPLVSGAIYRWQAEALGGSTTLAYAPAPPAAEARFQVLDNPRREELARTEARFGGFPLVMAVAFARAGLEEAATAQLTLLAREHPDSPGARHLLRQAETASQSPSPITTNGAQ